MVTGYLDIFSHELLFCLFSKIGLYTPVLEIFFSHCDIFSTWFVKCSVVLKFLMLMKSILLNTFFVVVPFNVFFEKNCPPSKVTRFSYVSYTFYVPVLKCWVFNVPTIHSVFCETEFYPIPTPNFPRFIYCLQSRPHCFPLISKIDYID